jgi:hypothetical protein
MRGLFYVVSGLILVCGLWLAVSAPVPAFILVVLIAIWWGLSKELQNRI